MHADFEEAHLAEEHVVRQFAQGHAEAFGADLKHMSGKIGCHGRSHLGIVTAVRIPETLFRSQRYLRKLLLLSPALVCNRRECRDDGSLGRRHCAYHCLTTRVKNFRNLLPSVRVMRLLSGSTSIMYFKNS